MAPVTRAAGLVVYREANGIIEYLLLQASYPPHHWTPPKGHVDPGEDEWTAALRETKEEAGILPDQLSIDKGFNYVQHYDVKGKPKSVAYWLAKLIVPFEVVLSHEHQKMNWFNLKDSIEITNYKEMEQMLRAADDYIQKKLGGAKA
uniref:Bis(5'-nucleosyl)-tetraphosphatase [asymmetrical] n=1 Tax=Panagrellus redivivus TaxID=6233 RepID=A0A7E4VFH2_PANRE